MSSPADLWDRVSAVHHQLSDLSSRDELVVLSAAWLAIASNSRTETGTGEGFLAEQAAQSSTLAKMADLVRGAVPDPEMERRYHDGDIEGVIQLAADAIAGKRSGTH